LEEKRVTPKNFQISDLRSRPLFWGGCTHRRALPPPPSYRRCPPPSAAVVTNPALRLVRACYKLQRYAGTSLTATDCAVLMTETFACAEVRELVSLESNPGVFYASLADAIAKRTLAPALAIPDRHKVALFCIREAAEEHAHPASMCELAKAHYAGRGARLDPQQAVRLWESAADLGHEPSMFALGPLLLYGDARTGVAKDAVRGFELQRQAVAQGEAPVHKREQREALVGSEEAAGFRPAPV
jgi:hypothetical protein